MSGTITPVYPGKGFSRSNLSYIRKFYIRFPKRETVSHKLSWSHYFELLKIDDDLAREFYQNQAIKENWTVREKQDNSNSQERINLIERYILLFGSDSIECIVADREFVGERWLKYLNDNGLRYYIRIRNNFKVFIPRKNETVKAFLLFNAYNINEFVYYPNIVKINGQLCYVANIAL